MQKRLQKKSAIFFVILFMTMLSAPTLIISIDDSTDVTFFYGDNEEEEKESFKILFEITPQIAEDSFIDCTNEDNDGYTFKTYPKPHLNLISPPPEFTS